MLPLYARAATGVGVPLAELLRPLARPAAATALLAVAVVAVRLVTDPGPVQLVAGGLAGLAAYLPLVAPLRHLIRGSENAH